MNKEDFFGIWAPEAAVWSRWAKPVLFAHLDLAEQVLPSPEMPVNVKWVPSVQDKVALIIDLPGAEGVFMGAALAAQGYQPVPLYNAIPLPCETLAPGPEKAAAVDVLPIINALKNEADKMAALKIPSDAPPAFLLDANRQGDTRKVQPGNFDNRSISFHTDFPSASFLTTHGIQHILLVQNGSDEPQDDLNRTLWLWQEGGIKLESVRLDDLSARPTPFRISRPSWLLGLLQRWFSILRFGDAALQGFGRWIHDSPSGG
ncbi:MAG: hypothetical protein WCD79_12375 [Chthoniobacteraceae bacterium]